MGDNTPSGPDQAPNVTNGNPMTSADRVAQVVRGILSADAKGDFADFVRILFERADADDLERYSPEALAGIAKSIWQLTETRQPGTKLVRVFNPEESTYLLDDAHTVIQVVTDDTRFIIDSVLTELTSVDVHVQRILHPIIEVQRDEHGRRHHIERPAAVTRDSWSDRYAREKGFVRESVLHLEIDRIESADEHRAIESRIDEVLSQVTTVVTDWPDMTHAIADCIRGIQQYAPASVDRDDLRETIAFLQWLQSDNFAYLGVRDYEIIGDLETGELRPVADSGLGLLRDPNMRVLRRKGEMVVMTPEVREFLMQSVPIIVAKANVLSRVHRRASMDYVGIKLYGRDGSVIGERRLVGLFTASAYNRSPRDIPLLARKVALVVGKAGLPADSHDERSLMNILETYPRDELFQASVGEILDTSLGLLRLQKRPKTKVFARYDRFDRYVSVLAYLPRDKYDTDLRIKIGDLLAEIYGGRIAEFTPTFLQGPLIRVHFIIVRPIGVIPRASLPDLEATIEKYMRGWVDDLRSELIKVHGGSRGRSLGDRYARGFSSAYRDTFDAATAMADISVLERLGSYPAIALMSYRKPGDPETAIRLKLYRWDAPVPLSDCMVVFENMGLKVIDEIPYTVEVRAQTAIAQGEAPSDRTMWIYDFFMSDRLAKAIDLEVVKSAFEEAFSAVWFGHAENDGFNRLVVEQGLGWREVVILRALSRFQKQAGSPFSDAYIISALIANETIARLLIDLFRWRFDPDIPGPQEDRLQRQNEIADAINEALESVHSLDADRIIRQFTNLIMAAQRTNFYQTEDDGAPKPYLSIKFASQEIPDLPEPKPFYEIFVYSPRFEGVHLRGGKVARGGIRWSDRAEDFRSEVLGLVKAQLVKNSVIVPVGAKGGFFPKQLPGAGASRDEVTDEAIACYRLFISGLLDLTNNVLEDGTITVLNRVVCYDDPDTYLVVAADKGTAAFSDIANDVAKSYGFWLGDAFASGGAIGYDHKKMGITARGAWEAVKRHFRELGTDIQTTPFTAAGQGDMSGDVFGNGMLLSRQTRLIAAFDHRDIFLDPDPDPEVSYRERERLFQMPRSSWADYDRSLISKGGGVFSRMSKAIPLSPEVREVLGLSEARVTPHVLMQAILSAQVDLLWFGGIGTYVKAAGENNLDVSDRANDPLRVDGADVRARVIGEGANLAVTQRGRIEFARKGGRINTDFVDNAGGVDCSDHEVNIKIALDSVVRSGILSGEQRDALLGHMTDEVADLVLRSNYNQTLALTLAEITSPADLDAHGRFMRSLERKGALARTVEFLPDDEQLRELKESGYGLSRPEIAVLLAYAKITLYNDLLDSDVPDDPYLDGDLIAYFPQVMGEKLTDALCHHRLKREIIATIIANETVNTGGLTFVNRIQDFMGVPAPDVVRAFLVARDVFGVPDLWARVDALDGQVPALVQLRIYETIRIFLRRQVLWFLRYRPAELGLESAIAVYRDAVTQFARGIEGQMAQFSRDQLNHRIATLRDEGLEDSLARDIAILDVLSSSCDIIDVAQTRDWTPEEVAVVYFAIGAALNLDRLRADAITLSSDEHWERLAIRRTIEDLFRQQRLLTNGVIQHAQQNALDTRSGQAVVDVWLQDNERDVNRVTGLIVDMEASGPLTGAKLSLAGSQIRDLLSGFGGRRKPQDVGSTAI